jgi:hypothetical protein
MIKLQKNLTVKVRLRIIDVSLIIRDAVLLTPLLVLLELTLCVKKLNSLQSWMPKFRRKLSAVFRDFDSELKRLESFDAENQARISAFSGSISVLQLHFITEAIFFKAFRAYESFVRDVFLLYCLEKRPKSGGCVTSYLSPKGFLHAEELIQSSMRFLDWTNPDTIIERAELYLKDGFPVKLPYTIHRENLLDFKKIRNHIAHDSKESLSGYLSVIRRHFGVVPLRIPPPGEFLLVTDRNDPNKYKLLVFFDLMRKISYDLI